MSALPLTPDWARALCAANVAKRCHARCKHSKRPCKGPAMRGKAVCRMHGGKGGAPRGVRHGNYRTGRHTLESKALHREMREERQRMRALMLLAMFDR
jgi:hypothetical protein